MLLVNFIKQIVKTSKEFYEQLKLFKDAQRFKTKKKFLSLSFEQIKSFVGSIPHSDYWNGGMFPTFGDKDRRDSNSTPSKVSKKTSINRRGSPSKKTSLWYNKLLSIRPLALPSYLWTQLNTFKDWCLDVFKRSTGDALSYIKALAIAMSIDAMLTDDEPLWEPIEWSLVQVWIMFMFAFGWIAENLITSRYGAYTGRDKRVWFSWYKTFWLVEGWYVLSLGAAGLFVMIPFYHEINYTLPLVLSWWNWYSRVFFFKFISIYSLVLYLAYYMQLNLGSWHWKKSFLVVILINLFLFYLLYINFMMAFFAYFTDPNWYHRTRLTDYIHLSHEPNKWSWGNAKRDHFSYHKSSTVFWFKNDGPFAAAFLFFHILFFLCLFALAIYWVTLFRRIYATQEITFTYTTYCVSALRQFFYYFLLLYVLIFFSFVVQYWRLPIEYAWITNCYPIATTLQEVLLDYPSFLVSIFF